MIVLLRNYLCCLTTAILLFVAAGTSAFAAETGGKTGHDLRSPSEAIEEKGLLRGAKRSLRLTDREKAWLSRNKTIRVAFDGHFPPYSFLDDAGELDGLAVDVMRVLAERAGVAIETSPKTVWKDLYEAAQNREVDVVATMGRRPEREQWFVFTRPYIFKSLVIMTREQTTAINKPRDLVNKRVALVKSYQYVKPLLDTYPSIKPYYVDTMLDGLNAVAVGEADAAITFFGAGHYLKTKYQIANLKFAAIFERDRFTESIAVRKDWPELVAILDKALASITEDEMKELAHRWVGQESDLGIAPRTVFLYLAVVLGVVLFLVSGGTIWNRALKKQVSQKTKELRQELAERRKAEDALRESEAQLRKLYQEFYGLLDAIPDNLMLLDKDMKIVWANRATAASVGGTTDELIGRFCYDRWHKRATPCEPCPVAKSFASGRPRNETVMSADGRIWDIRTVPLIDERGSIARVIEVKRDISEHRKLEAQYLHAQKMESIGTLAGGVAHDFNNILTAIVGYGHMALMKMAEDDPQRLNIEPILEAADRAAYLTKSLLLFSRKQVPERKHVDLNVVIGQLDIFLKRIIGEDIACKKTVTDHPLTVFADKHQLEQVLMNLATNARDAMPGGGIFTVTTEHAALREDFIAVHGYGKPGDYAMITVSDTGTGMDDETRKRIFEPFFTTKEVGKGTGLGLAVVYGIIKQHDGFVNVYSEPGKGTTFRIYMPVIASEMLERPPAPQTEAPVRGTETVLIAEDDDTLRKLTKTILTQYGYTVIEAIDGEDAVRKFIENENRIQILLFDLIMPKKNGKEAYDRIRKINPDIMVVFASGYAPDLVRQRVSLEESARLVYKPLSPMDLLRTLRSVLDKTEK